MAKNEDIKYCENDAFLEKPSSDMLKAKIFENQIIFFILSKKIKGPKQNTQNRLRSPTSRLWSPTSAGGVRISVIEYALTRKSY